MLKPLFFVLGLEIEKYPSVLNRMIAEGHEIGNHTYHHKNLKNLPLPEVAAEINSTQNLIYSITDYKPHILRPPGGEYNPGDPVLADYPLVLWSADPWDWKHKNPTIIDQESIKQIMPGSILLLHDIYPTSIGAVPTIVDNFKKPRLHICDRYRTVWLERHQPITKGAGVKRSLIKLAEPRRIC